MEIDIIDNLLSKSCTPCEGGTTPLTDKFAKHFMQQIHTSWALSTDGKTISRTIELRNHYEITAFLNAVNWISHREDHHPDICYGYKDCKISYTTHAIKGLSENDFICAAKIDVLVI